MLDVTGFNEYNIKLDSVIGNDTRHTKIVPTCCLDSTSNKEHTLK